MKRRVEATLTELDGGFKKRSKLISSAEREWADSEEEMTAVVCSGMEGGRDLER